MLQKIPVYLVLKTTKVEVPNVYKKKKYLYIYVSSDS